MLTGGNLKPDNMIDKNMIAQKGAMSLLAEKALMLATRMQHLVAQLITEYRTYRYNGNRYLKLNEFMENH